MDWMLYVANGYTGELIAREARNQGKRPILAGRNEAKIAALREDLQLPARVFSLNSPPSIEEALRGVSLVLNCAGPFSKTAEPTMRACIAAGAHYLDITGEIDVFECAHRLDTKAAGVVLCPGVGFDVVPTDCIALMLKRIAGRDRTGAGICDDRPEYVERNRKELDSCGAHGRWFYIDLAQNFDAHFFAMSCAEQSSIAIGA